MKKTILTILIGVFIATSLSASSLGQGKMKASISTGYKLVTGENDTSINQIKIGQQSGFAFLSTNDAGLSFSYGITDDIDIMYTMPVFLKTDAEATFVFPVVGETKIEQHSNTTLGSPLLGIVYHKNLGNLGLRLAPYLGLPFAQMVSSSDKDGKALEDKDKNGDDTSYNFKQPIVLGLSVAIDSKMEGKIYWQAWLNLNAGMGGTEPHTLKSLDHTSLTTSISGLIGYKIDPKSIVKLQLFWITPDLLAEELKDENGKALPDEAQPKGFADGSLLVKVLYGMKINKNAGFNVSPDISISLTDKGGKTPFGTDATFSGGFTVDYWMTF